MQQQLHWQVVPAQHSTYIIARAALASRALQAPQHCCQWPAPLAATAPQQPTGPSVPPPAPIAGRSSAATPVSPVSPALCLPHSLRSGWGSGCTDRVEMSVVWDERRSIARWETLRRDLEPPTAPAAVCLPQPAPALLSRLSCDSRCNQSLQWRLLAAEFSRDGAALADRSWNSLGTPRAGLRDGAHGAASVGAGAGAGV